MVCHELDCKAFNKKNALGRKQEMVYIYPGCNEMTGASFVGSRDESHCRWTICR